MSEFGSVITDLSTRAERQEVPREFPENIAHLYETVVEMGGNINVLGVTHGQLKTADLLSQGFNEDETGKRLVPPISGPGVGKRRDALRNRLGVKTSEAVIHTLATHYFFPRIGRARIHEITEEQAQVVRLRGEGLSGDDVVDKIGLDKPAQSMRVTRALARTGAKNLGHMIRLADQESLLEDPDIPEAIKYRDKMVRVGIALLWLTSRANELAGPVKPTSKPPIKKRSGVQTKTAIAEDVAGIESAGPGDDELGHIETLLAEYLVDIDTAEETFIDDEAEDTEEIEEELKIEKIPDESLPEVQEILERLAPRDPVEVLENEQLRAEMRSLIKHGKLNSYSNKVLVGLRYGLFNKNSSHSAGYPKTIFRKNKNVSLSDIWDKVPEDQGLSTENVGEILGITTLSVLIMERDFIKPFTQDEDNSYPAMWRMLTRLNTQIRLMSQDAQAELAEDN